MSAQSAINKTEGPCVILAGAGTGKTHTIVEKIKYLIENKVCDPERIVCITFSNEAANNVFLRVQRALPLERGKEPVVRTFHAFSADLLRKHGHLIGISEDFKILDPNEAKVILHKHLRVQPYYCRSYIASLGTAKDLGITLEDMQRHLNGELASLGGIDIDKKLEDMQFSLQTLHLKKDTPEKKQIVAQVQKLQDISSLRKFLVVWSAYEKIKAKSNYQDYGDLNVNALKLLQQHPHIAAQYSCVIVDEFQDTNKMQLEFLLALAPHRNITIVGDLNQSIYRFRGAYKENFTVFKQHFGVTAKDIFNLDKSHRSSNKILRTAHKLIVHNYSDPNECFMVENAEQREGESLEVYELKDAKEEARKVVELVQREISAGRTAEDICILFRTHQQGRVIKRALEMQNIAYTSVAKSPLLSNGAIKTIVDYLTIIDKLRKKEKGGEQAWWDLMYQLHFVEQDLIVIGKFMKEHKESECISTLLFDSLANMPLSGAGKLLSKVISERLQKLLALAEKDVVQLLPAVYGVAGISLDQKTKEGKENALNLQKFLELAQNHAALYAPDLSSFLHYLDILHTLEIDVPAADATKEGVHLMTLHATKGLEYKVVIVTNMVQKRFPMEKIEHNALLPTVLLPELKELKASGDERESLVRQYEQQHQLAEERRLCYVAFTRAKEKLILTYAQEYAAKKHFPSSFLHEIGYKQNPDCAFVQELEQKYAEPEVELRPASRFSYVLNSSNFDQLLPAMVQSTDRQKMLTREKKAFSPSSLLLFTECQKQYEYQYVYHMPEKKTLSWDAIRLGSFVHEVLEKGVREGYTQLKQFLDYAREMQLQTDWASVELNEAEHMIRVFFERNKDKYSKASRTEQILATELGGFSFIGFADRIDERPEGLEIVDYKTGKWSITPRHRNWQLGYYALAARKLGKVHKITLDMLKQEKPLEFVLDEKGNAQCLHSDRMDFNIFEVEEELISTAKAIVSAHEKGFTPCSLDKNCEFCNEYVHRL